ncbi:T9SS type B sorting domain-containing protein [Winogradskyella psychrotolerans]|uniref:T9SS type B sorting domain-containing protein n=1 Tax=Winogradskyella psychrotolerans TaxID=1344585 RepID=UPI001C07815D|nr:T9SS type B sorting domain-containing protein [Winogradskyella psychrotolerans]MBU2926704.1 T9SS type B sorting domain-containing protein [Winogradskyella psychrotolerans]
MRLIYLLILVLISSVGFSQNEANIWYFGNHAGLDFNSGSPVALTDGQLNTIEGCASIADENGNLLFYTNGINVWDKTHQIMPNGSGLNGNESSTNAAIIVPKPSNSNIYYIFTLDERGYANGLQYSEVDMSLNGGNGDVTATKNVLLETPVTEKITAVKVSGEDAFWVIAHRWNSSDFISYKVTSAGINTTPIVSSVGSYLGGFSTNAIGGIKVSPDGTKLAVANLGLWEAQLFDFNSTTGVVSNPFTILEFDWESAPYGIEFSPNSNLLYVSVKIKGIYQFNLVGSQTDILNSETRVGPLNISNSSLQLATDGKIYLALFGGAYLDIIDSPNTAGVGCNYISDGVFLNGNTSENGLPPFVQSFFNVGILVNNVCYGEATQFNSNISQAYDTLVWDFGDGNTSTEENPIHTYASSGDYEVSLSVTSGSESSIDIKAITIFEAPTVTPIVDLKQCDDDLDGFGIFNLNEVKSEISANHLSETITFYESQSNAENTYSPIQNSIDYTNQLVSSETIWARVENANGCYQISQLNLAVSTTRTPETFNRIIYQCDDDTAITDGVSAFDLSGVNSEIEALFPVGQQLSINYYRNLDEAQSETNPITDISNYENTGYPNTQQIYVRIDSALNEDCLSIEPLITLKVETAPIANTVSILQHCNDNGDNMYAFDTSDIETELLNGQTNVMVEYYDELGNALSSPLPNPFVSSTQDITARVSNSNSQNNESACYDETTLHFVVQNAVIAHPLLDITQCDDNNDGVFDFDTSNIEAQVLNGQTGMLVSYFDESGNTLPSPLSNPFTSETQAITIRVENELSANCFDETTLNFVVSEQPVANNIASNFICIDVSNDLEYTFNLLDYNTQILGGQSSLTFEIIYFTSELDAQNNNNSVSNIYTVNSNYETIYARIQNINNNNCFEITSFELGVAYLPIAYQPEAIIVCDDESNDGIKIFDLTIQNDSILNGQSSTENSITYHLNAQDSEEGINPLPTNFANITNPQTIYARIENINSSDCYSTTSFEVIVNEQPVLLMNDLWPICEGGNVQIIADEGYDYYTWSTGQTTRAITVDEPGQYTVTVSNIYDNEICSVEKTITVSISDIAIITDIETVDWSQNNNTISIFVEGSGDYEYSLDGNNYQDTNMFSGLYIDEYTVYVRDKNGCGIVSEDVFLIYYPRFFTPNGDGENETWQIINSVKESNNKVYIYDRYGKLIKQLQPNDFGWDGTLNGSQLPTSDYWFVLKRQNGKRYTGHFSLKR